MLTIPYFKVRINGSQDYIVLSHKSFSLENNKLELKNSDKQYFDYCKSLNINDHDSIILSKFSQELTKQMSTQETWSKAEFLNKACTVLISEASEANME